MHRRDFVRTLAATLVAALVERNLGAACVPAIRIKNMPPGVDADSLARAYCIECNGEFDNLDWAREIARDFDSATTVRVNGWIFARTELKLCATCDLRSGAR